MGTWDDGLYDNDDALDWLGDIFDELSLEKSPAHFIVGLGLFVWMESSAIEANPDRLQVLLDKHRANDATTEERDFFDGYVARVRAGFELLSNAGGRPGD